MAKGSNNLMPLSLGEKELSFTSVPLINRYKSPEISYNLCGFDTRIIFDDPKLVYSTSLEMNQQQTCRESSFYVGCNVQGDSGA